MRRLALATVALQGADAQSVLLHAGLRDQQVS